MNPVRKMIDLPMTGARQQDRSASATLGEVPGNLKREHGLVAAASEVDADLLTMPHPACAILQALECRLPNSARKKSDTCCWKVRRKTPQNYLL